MMPELYLAPALAPSASPSSACTPPARSVARPRWCGPSDHRRHPRRVLTVAFEKQSDSDAMWALSVPQPFSAPLLAGAGGYFAPHIRAYMRRSGAPRDTGMLVAVKDRLQALKNPYAHLHIPDISLQMVEESVMLWDPLHYLEACRRPTGRPPWCSAPRRPPPRRRRRPVSARLGAGYGHALGATMFAGRDQVNPQAGRTARKTSTPGRHRNPREDLDCAEVTLPFSWYEPMWLENLGFCAEGDGWKLTQEGDRLDGGDIPWNCSGGCSAPTRSGLGHAPLLGGRPPGAR